MASKKTPKPSLHEKLAAADTREPQTRIVRNAIRRMPGTAPNSYKALVLPAGLGLIRRMARKGSSKGSVAHALGISLEKFNEALRDQPEVLDALTAGLSGLEDELTDILLEHGVPSAHVHDGRSRSELSWLACKRGRRPDRRDFPSPAGRRPAARRHHLVDHAGRTTT